MVLISLSLNTQFKEHYRALLLAYKYIHTSRTTTRTTTTTTTRFHTRTIKRRARELKREFRERVYVPVRNNRTGNRESDPRVRCRTVFVVVADGKENAVVVAPSSRSLFKNKGKGLLKRVVPKARFSED